MLIPGLLFTITAVAIVFIGTKLSHCGDQIAELSGLGRLWIGVVLMAAATGKKCPPEEFHIEAKLGTNPYNIEKTFKSFLELGFNSIWWGAYPDTKPYLDNFQGILMAENGRSRKDYIHHYATGYYSRWQAEQNQVINRVGLKHKYGKAVIWNGVHCWSSNGLATPKDSLIYGPHYRQEKRYKRWLYDEPGWSRYDVYYNVRFRMALRYVPGLVSQDENVCIIKVVYRYIYLSCPPARVCCSRGSSC